MRISDIVDQVAVKNRIVDAAVVGLLLDSEELVWKPGEVKYMPKVAAEHFRRKSEFKLNPENGKRDYKLVILGHGQDESDLTLKIASRAELMDRENMSATNFDPQTGEPLNVKYLDPNQVSGVNEAERLANSESVQAKEVAGKQAAASARRHDLAGQIEEAAAALPPEAIEGAVKSIVKHGERG